MNQSLRVSCPACGSVWGRVSSDGRFRLRLHIIAWREGKPETSCPRCKKSVPVVLPRELAASLATTEHRGVDREVTRR